MSKGHHQTTTSIEIDSPIIGKIKANTGNPWVMYSSIALVLLLVGFWIYSKYWHRPLMAKVKRKKK